MSHVRVEGDARVKAGSTLAIENTLELQAQDTAISTCTFKLAFQHVVKSEP